GARASRLRVDPGQRDGHDRPVERLDPALAQKLVEPDHPADEDDDEGGERVAETAEAEVVHRGCIVGAWTAKARSASSTSTSTPSRWPGSTRTSPTSPTRSTSSRSRSLGSTTRSRRARCR